jgi:hypothetical protein
LKEDVLNIRALTSNDAAGYDAAEAEEDSGFWISVAHLLTPACVYEVMACRTRCKMQACSPRRTSTAGSGSVFKVWMGAYSTCFNG